MANLMVSSANWGPVLKSDSQSDFPCMDTNYRELIWSFTVLKDFSSYNNMIDFEQDTIPTYFSNREKNVSYSGETENDCYLQSFKRKELVSPGPPCYAEYEIIFTKEG